MKDWFSAHTFHSEKVQYEWLEKIFKTGDGRTADFKNMQKRLEGENEQRLIHTVRGTGYVLREP